MEGLYPEAFNTYLQILEEFFSYPEAFSGDSHGGNGIGWDKFSADQYEWASYWGYLDLPEEDREDEACYRLETQYEYDQYEDAHGHQQPMCVCRSCIERMIIEDSPQFIRVKHGWAEVD